MLTGVFAGLLGAIALMLFGIGRLVIRETTRDERRDLRDGLPTAEIITR